MKSFIFNKKVLIILVIVSICLWILFIIPQEDKMKYYQNKIFEITQQNYENNFTNKVIDRYQNYLKNFDLDTKQISVIDKNINIADNKLAKIIKQVNLNVIKEQNNIQNYQNFLLQEKTLVFSSNYSNLIKFLQKDIWYSQLKINNLKSYFKNPKLEVEIKINSVINEL